MQSETVKLMALSLNEFDAPDSPPCLWPIFLKIVDETLFTLYWDIYSIKITTFLCIVCVHGLHNVAVNGVMTSPIFNKGIP